MHPIGPEFEGFMPAHLAESVLFDDRGDAGRRLAHGLPRNLHRPVVVGTTRGGVAIGAEVALALRAPLDVVIAAPVRQSPECAYAVGAAAPGAAVYLSEEHGMSAAQSVVAVARAHKIAARDDILLHEHCRHVALEGRDVVLVDEAITTGATMAAATAWAREFEPARLVAAVPVGAAAGLGLVRRLADEVVCLYEFEVIGSRAVWFGDFPRPEDDEVRRLLEATR
ncbi:MAG TPA: phosphoribosyltransferase family protein [Gaiellaceae bacterium]|nr:phosphoribosyltransferase family protein [Gaiellaceae bacterium]